jgi:putative membrane protein
MDIDIYKTAKALHIIFFTTWMAGLFYLPRLFVYHCQVKTKTQEYQRFVIMEKNY